MQVTNTMLSQSFLYNLNQLETQLSTEENQMSTGKSLNQPSDNPLAMSQDLADRTTISETGSYLSVLQTGLTNMTSTQSVLQQMTSTLQSVQSTVLAAINGTDQSSAQLQGLGQSLQQMVSSLYQLADTRQGTQYLFGGYADNQQVSPYVSTNQIQTNMSGASATAAIVTAGGTVTLMGNAGSAQVSIAAGASINGVAAAINGVTSHTGVIASVQTVAGSSALVLQPQAPGSAISMTAAAVQLAGGAAFAATSSTTGTAPTGSSSSVVLQVAESISEKVNVTGSQLFNRTPANGSATLQQTLQSILDHVGNPGALQGDLHNLDANIQHVISVTTQLGARMNQMQALQTQQQQLVSNMQSDKAALENANMAQVEVNYQNQLTAYNAALKIGSQLLLQSLVQYV